MTIAGESSFNTCSGMLMTLLVLALTLIFAVLGAFQLKNYEQTSYQSKEVFSAIDVD